MKILIYPKFLVEMEAIELKQGSYPLYGRIYDDLTVCHFVGISDSSQYSDLIGSLSIGLDENNTPNPNNIFPFIHAKLKSDDFKDLNIELFDKGGEQRTETKLDIEIVDLDRLFVRVDVKETPLDILQTKTVAIIGMGSGGSLLALYLAKSGVKKFIFIDDDCLETHNIIRHISDLNHLGRYKTFAVKDFIEQRIPDVSIRTVEKKFSLHTKTDADFFLELFSEIDLIVAVSGDHTDNYVINDFIHTNDLQIPTIYAGTFDSVKGGLMFKVDPRENDYCYHCVYPEPMKKDGTTAVPTPSELEKKITYDRTLQEQIAQPGLGLDIDNLTIFLSKFCLSELLKGYEHGLYDFPHKFYLWYNRTITEKETNEIKFDGLELCYYEDLGKDSRCPFHIFQLEGDSKEDNN